jgi:G:T-mismatch repair DNA endonuclease (very short patch repair protein)
LRKQTAATKNKRRRTLKKKYGVTRSLLLATKTSKPQQEITETIRSMFPELTVFENFPILKKRGCYKADILLKEINVIIEFNGTYWHCDPRFYKNDYFNKRKKLKAEKIWRYDSIRKEHLESLGYRVIVIWEHDYNNSREDTLKILKEDING